MLKLWHLDRSPFGWKVRMVLKEKNVPHEIVVPENKNENAAFAKLNPFKLTPVLELPGGRAIYESTIINEYLEETYPDPPMLPKDPWERARVRMLEDTTDQYLNATLREFRASQFEYAPPFLIRKTSDAVDHALLESSRAKLHEHLARLESDLAGRTYFGGAMFSLADVALAPPLTASLRLLSVLPDTRYPLIAAWSARIVERSSYIASAPKEPLRLRD